MEEELEDEQNKRKNQIQIEDKTISLIKNKNCSLNEHNKIDAIKFCRECKIYMCNKCDKHHFELFKNHHLFNLDGNINDIFTGLCKEKNHNNKLDYFCKNHNILCCVACIAKIEGKGNGKHKDCDICFMQKIKTKKKKLLKQNLLYLENLSNSINESINKLKELYETISEDKEKLKLNIQKIFTNIRNQINQREDQLLSELDKKYDDIFFKEDLMKEFQKMPKKIDMFLEKGKISENDWKDKKKLNSLINDCLEVEKIINDIKDLDEKLKKFTSKTNIQIKFNPEEDEINEFLKLINNFGKIIT